MSNRSIVIQFCSDTIPEPQDIIDLANDTDDGRESIASNT